MIHRYEIVFKQSVLKDIRRLPRKVLTSIQIRIEELAIDPFPSGMESISGYEHYYRVRIGHYRIVYEVATTIRVITIVKIGHRKDVYRRLP